VVANRVLSHLRGLFKWAIRNDYISVNPALDIDRPHEEKPRRRTLAEAEVNAVWHAFDQMAWPFGTLGQLLLLTGQRRGEWAGASWSEIDLERATWTLPADRSKTDEPQMLPLTPQVLAILAMIPRLVGTDLIFPSSRAGSDNPISGFSKALVTAHRLSGTTGWHWHDLRRTARTGFARLGITAAVGERILNHSDGTRSRIAAVYDTHSYLPEMNRALELWAGEVERIVAGAEGKIVALRR
jgi:integrase